MSLFIYFSICETYSTLSITAYFALDLTSFLWNAENPATARFPSLAVCSHIWTLPVFLQVYAPALLEAQASLVNSEWPTG